MLRLPGDMPKRFQTEGRLHDLEFGLLATVLDQLSKDMLNQAYVHSKFGASLASAFLEGAALLSGL